jgi:hypothetical protein
MCTNDVLQRRLSAEDEILYTVEERLSLFGFGLEFVGFVEFCNVLFKCLANIIKSMIPLGMDFKLLTGQSVQLSNERSLPGSTVSTYVSM